MTDRKSSIVDRCSVLVFVLCAIAPTFRWGTKRRKNSAGFSPKQIICGTIYKTLSGVFIVGSLLPGRCPSLCYFSPLGKSGIVPVHKSLIYEQGTAIFDFGTGQS